MFKKLFFIMLITAANTAAGEPDYLPMATGNYWKYTDGTETRITGEKLLANGRITKVSESNCRECDNGTWTSYLYNNSEGVVVYYTTQGDEPIFIIKHPLSTGAFWLDHEQDTCYLAGYESVAAVSDTFDNCIKLETKNKGSVITGWYAPGVGLVKFVTETDTMVLMEYQVN